MAAGSRGKQDTVVAVAAVVGGAKRAQNAPERGSWVWSAVLTRVAVAIRWGDGEPARIVLKAAHAVKLQAAKVVGLADWEPGDPGSVAAAAKGFPT